MKEKPKQVDKPKEESKPGIQLKPTPGKPEKEPETKDEIKLKPVPPKQKPEEVWKICRLKKHNVLLIKYLDIIFIIDRIFK